MVKFVLKLDSYQLQKIDKVICPRKVDLTLTLWSGVINMTKPVTYTIPLK